MKHPEGRLLAIQQQMFFATVLADELNMPPEVILRKLGMAGLRLMTDEQEIAIDASAVFPAIDKMKKQHLASVPDIGGE